MKRKHEIFLRGNTIYIYQRILKMKEREKKGKKQTFSFELFGTPAILRNTLQN